ncbi:MAG: efflux RND transporter periplasmic adaptor subunit [Rhodomicrobium sp.]
MKRLTPYLIFVLLTAGLLAYIYKDQILPPAATDSAQGPAAGGQGGGGRHAGSGGSGYRRGEQIVPVVAGKVRTANVPVYLNGVGTVQAFNTATVRTQVSGRLIDVPYTEGQEVKEGDVLAIVDSALYQAAYDQAVAQKAKDEALLANARLDEKRYADLVKTNAATQQQADTAKWTVFQDEAQVKLDQALIDNARANLQWATIKAPLTGRTGIRLVDRGNLVSSADATGIVIITQLRPIAVVFTLPENTVGDVLDASALGPVQLQAVTGNKVIGEGKLLVIDNQIDQTTGTYRIKGTFPNEQNRLWPGQFVNVRLKLKILPDAMVVPSVAVQQGASGSYVYLITPESTAKIAPVTLVQEGERETVLASGVAPGDSIVTAGFASLQDGSKVRVDTSGAAATAAEGPQAAAPAVSAGSEQRRPRRQEAASGEAAAPNGEHRHRRKQNQAGGEQAGVAEVAPAGQGSAKP